MLRGTRRQFGREQFNRRELLNRILEDIETGDFIFWLDADEVVYASRAEIEEICDALNSQGYDGAELPHTGSKDFDLSMSQAAPWMTWIHELRVLDRDSTSCIHARMRALPNSDQQPIGSSQAKTRET